MNEDHHPRKTAAVELVRLGFHVFAVKHEEKRPDPLLAPDGFKNASADPEKAGAWFDVKRKANIGIACGADYDLVVIDVDVKNNAPGMQTYAELGLGGCVTRTANTPSGGYHLYFRHPGVALKAKLPGIDIKGADGGGYVLAPPSTLPNGAYTWRDAEMPIAELPADLLERLAAPQASPRKPAVKPQDGPVASIKTRQGSRHERLVELGAIYRGKGLSDEEITALLWHYGTEFCDPPFDRNNSENVHEIEAIVRWYGGKAVNAESGPLAVITTAELMARAAEDPTPCIIDPLLPAAGNLMIFGPSGCGKSHIGLALSIAVATGRSILGWNVSEPASVLYVDGEMPLDELKERIESYLHGRPLPEKLFWLAARAVEGDLPDLADAQGQVRYQEAIESCVARVVVFDNLSCLRLTSADAPENSTESWHPVAAFIRRLNNAGVAAIVVHHASKAGTQRGASHHVAVFDTVVNIRRPGEGQADPLAENDIEIVFDKHRRFGGEAAKSFRAKAVGDADGYVTWTDAGDDPLVDDVVRLKKSGHSIRETAEILKRSKAGIEKAILRAKAQGKWPLRDSE
jgi:hypothetical protein